jgi:hypothetical protein
MPLPAPQPSVRVVTLKIDGLDLSAREDETIIEVCRENKIPIPSLCWMDGLSVGAPAGCAWSRSPAGAAAGRLLHPGRRGHGVQTNTEKLQRYRRTLVELLFAERNHVCSVCVSNGHCELQWLAQPAASTMCACPTATPATTSTAATRCSASTTTAACSAPAACASATRSRAPTPGTSWAAAATARSSPTWPTLGRQRHLHQLRQVRAGLPDRRPGETGHFRRRDGQRPALPAHPGPTETHPMSSTNPVATPPPATTQAQQPSRNNPAGPRSRSPPPGSTAAPAATCRSSTWTSAWWTWPIRSTSSTARWWTPRAAGAGGRRHSGGLHQQRGGPAQGQEFRKHCKLLISLGDCAVNGNVPAMRNPFKLDDVIDRAYRDNVDLNPQVPTEGVPALLPGASPSTASSMWMSSCPAAHRMRMPSTTC